MSEIEKKIKEAHEVADKELMTVLFPTKDVRNKAKVLLYCSRWFTFRRICVMIIVEILFWASVIILLGVWLTGLTDEDS
jgi:hypothetical protein